jgi:hypothetical protein
MSVLSVSINRHSITFVQMNLIYLGLITDRIPIIPLFNPTHVQNAPSLRFSEVFDFPRLRKALGKPVLEWNDVKDPHSRDLEIIGCWNVWESLQNDDHQPRESVIPHQLRLGSQSLVDIVTVY